MKKQQIEKNKFEGFRTDLEDYFNISGIRHYKRLNHTPFIVINKNIIEIVYNIIDLLEYHDDVDVIGQWKGQWNSNFFKFTVKQLRDHIEKNPKEDYDMV